MKHFFYPLLFLLCLAAPALAQDVLRGRVLSANGQLPLPGASVRILGTTVGAVADSEGRFALPAQQAVDTLEVSYLGYVPRTVVVRHPMPPGLTITLTEDAQALGEVVISTGYEQLSPERVTGSYTVLSQDQLRRSTSPELLERLQGLVPGLTFDERTGSTPRLHIRGQSTLYANAAPLIVVDNFPYEGDLSAINPNDVESVTVLKDAAAASIWGARAGNGVIVITTRKGRRNQPLQVGLNANATHLPKPDFDYLPQMDSHDFIAVERYLFDKGFYNSQENSPQRPVLSPAVEMLIRHRDGELSSEQLEAGLRELGSHDVREDFERHLYTRGLRQQYALNLSGGTDKLTYYVSGGYDKEQGQLGDGNSRVSLRSESSYTLLKPLTLHLGLNYTQGQRRFGRPSYEAIRPDISSRLLYPYARLADDAGNPLPLPRDYRSTYTAGARELGLLNWDYVPLRDAEHIDRQAASQQVLLTAGTDLRLAPGLELLTRYQYARNSDEDRNLQEIGSYYARDLINRFTQQSETGTLSYPIPRGGILDTRLYDFRSHNARAQLRYDRGWGIHEVAALAGAELQSQHTAGQNFRAYGYDERTLTSTPVDYSGLYPNFQYPGRRQRIPDGTNFSDRTLRYTSLFANATYTYDRRYSLSASARKDASNLFGVASNQRGVPLWSTGLAWNAHQEAFFNASWVNRLRLKLSYGYNGNVDNTLTALATIVAVPGGNLINTPFAVVRTYPNPHLRWEKTATWNGGVEFGLLGERLSGTLDFYTKHSTDLIGDAPVDPTSGVLSGDVRRNIASMRGRGVDLSLTGRLLTGAFGWQSTLLLGYHHSEVTGYESGEVSGSRYVNSGLSVVPLEGRPLYSLFSYAWRGLDGQTGDPLGMYEGEVSTDYAAITRTTPLEELVYHGPAIAPWQGSLLQTFTYRGLSLSGNLTYRFGYFFRRPSIRYGQLFNSWDGHADYALRWQQPGDEQRTQVPSLVYPNNPSRDTFYQFSEALVERGDHVRLQDVTLSYELPRGGDRPRTLRSLQVYALARNLGILWRANDQGLDPDYPDSKLPPVTSFSLGLRAGF
ncbi:SusC/RagA family TonB-linked outer membrane protein [Pontibacter litorisediminis]|uniref:SusC/RagA family TonB-linked outer membrane protein n=1 Tax=Pontibacter litorisediminis TaxID=1846260 RepID=UPI0023EBD2BA|nr:SusC/RagA family TonB-linked outer membrane protein [Pontibacter litorisediminis]